MIAAEGSSKVAEMGFGDPKAAVQQNVLTEASRQTMAILPQISQIGASLIALVIWSCWAAENRAIPLLNQE